MRMSCQLSFSLLPSTNRAKWHPPDTGAAPEAQPPRRRARRRSRSARNTSGLPCRPDGRAPAPRIYLRTWSSRPAATLPTHLSWSGVAWRARRTAERGRPNGSSSGCDPSPEREPVIVARAPRARRAPRRQRPATAVEPLIRACSGVVDSAGAAEPRRDPPIRSASRAWHRWRRGAAQYDAFAHEALWPLCHRAHVKPAFRADDFTLLARQRAVRRRGRTRSRRRLAARSWSRTTTSRWRRCSFASAGRPSRIVTFWHIPWPHWQTFEICPWGQHLLEGLLGSSILGFQTPLDCRNFVETVERCLGAHIDRHQEAVTYDGRQVLVRVVSRVGALAGLVGVVRAGSGDLPRQHPSAAAARPMSVAARRRRRSAGSREGHRGEVPGDRAPARVLSGVPRPLRLRAARGAVPGRPRRLPRAAGARARDARSRQPRATRWTESQPIHLLEDAHAPSYVNLFLRAADLCYVGSLHDGMHLVAKEFVAARDDERGVLGAQHVRRRGARADRCADAEPLRRRRRRLGAGAGAGDAGRRAGRPDAAAARVVAEFSAWRWAAQILSDAARLRRSR